MTDRVQVAIKTHRELYIMPLALNNVRETSVERVCVRVQLLHGQGL